ncbi:hypothetical protein COX08_01600 [Candidatus Beckwithbacteria bacterium CG23_combo_of_CG06-09_8_20_14_all_34_8]|uniref:HD/PDEase domain-containing protein n=1 Tax=Candidatus Beckwithbacteria bacterium CG23_combo_of_CG06-09_8_20_14_all_34_8 TaxID=1974497 RepID=A0A2H0B6S5_9BACT|nr:MAG: hypothetical protein COX08_01600 [Candidatus Beckwithbacteria bacterium CG23_combo_of_CG06-09_8_20_14_all_34_8]
MAETYFSPLIENAIRLASYWHRGQMRKGGEFDYFTHLAAVANILAVAGFDEEIIAAGYCHDLLEDTKCPKAEIEQACGKHVLSMVEQVTEDKSIDEDKDWEKRKKSYIDQVAKASWQAKAVSCSDKIHNLQTLMAALEEYGLGYFDYFHRGPEKKLWFEDHMAMMLTDSWKHPLVNEYNDLVDNFVEMLEELDAKGENEELNLNLEKSDFDEPFEQNESGQIHSAEIDLVLGDVRDLLERNLLTQKTLIEFVKQQSKQIDLLTSKEKTVAKQHYIHLTSKTSSASTKNRSRYLEDDEFELLLPAVISLGLLKGALTSEMIQKHLKVNFTTAYRILKELKRLHVIARVDSSKPREVNKKKAQQLLEEFGR